MTACLFICDDDPVIGTVLSLDLGAAGFDVAPQLYSVAEAIEALSHRRPDLLLLDLHMPSGGGLDLLDYLATTGLHPGLPVLMLTGENDGFYIERARALGACGYLTKPIEIGTLAAKIDRVLGDSHLRWIDDLSALTEPATAAMGDAGFLESAAGRHLPLMTPTVATLTQVHGAPAIERLLRALIRQLNLIDLAGESELQAAAHAIRGAASSLGFTEAAEACLALEDAFKANRPTGDAHDHARMACRAARKRIDQTLETLAA